MRHSSDFGYTVSKGVRAAQPDLVMHAVVTGTEGCAADPTIGLVVGKSVGNAVVRHRVSRQLRHCARDLIPQLRSGERVVIRALPGSAVAPSSRLDEELRAALQRVRTAKAKR